MQYQILVTARVKRYKSQHMSTQNEREESRYYFLNKLACDKTLYQKLQNTISHFVVIIFLIHKKNPNNIHPPSIILCAYKAATLANARPLLGCVFRSQPIWSKGEGSDVIYLETAAIF